MILFNTNSTFKAEFTSDISLVAAAFADQHHLFASTFEDIVGVPTTEFYRGPYTAIPRMNSQTLATEGLLMANDVTIETIPVTYTTNTYGGKTVVIG